jgi:hypothetical protein
MVPTVMSFPARRLPLITLTRSLVRQLRSIYRRIGIKLSNHRQFHIVVETGASGLLVRARSAETIVEYHEPGELAAEQLVIPLEFLTDCEGPKSDQVTLEAHGTDKIVVTWTDKNIPQLVEYQAAKSKDVPTFPQPPEEFTENSPGLWKALHEASQSTDDASSRYALGYIQLRGSDGRVASTDGRQVYVHSGFQFSWQDETHILGSSLFAGKDLPQDQSVKIGKSGDWVTVALGPWTFRFSTLKEGKFPKIDDILKWAEPPVARLHVAPADAEFLVESLPRLPCDDSMHEPVTLDLNGKVVVRAKSATDCASTELVASNSHLVGDSMLLTTNRKFLVHALRLGFNEIGFKAPNSPALCVDGNRRYLWALLGSDGAIKASDNAVRIESPTDAGSHHVASHSISRRTRTVSHPTNETTPPVTERGPATKTKILRPKSDNQVSPVEQVIALRSKLRETVNQANELIRSLKRQKKQSRLLTTTLASLKELQKVAG